MEDLPQVFAGQGSSITNGSNGTATVNLRDLGTSRTLVLIDNRRLMPGDKSNPAADLDFIPAALVVPAALHYVKLTDQASLGRYLTQQYHIRTPQELSSCETCHR